MVALLVILTIVVAGCTGMPGATAWIGLLEHCKPIAGETVVVFPSDRIRDGVRIETRD